MKKKISLVLVLALGLTAEVANADFIFGTPTNLGPIVNSSSIDWSPSISADGLTLYFASNRPGGFGDSDLYVATRKTSNHDWGEPANLGPAVNSSAPENDPSISTDGLSLYFRSNRPGGYGGQDIWIATRATTNDDWGTPVSLGPVVNSLSDEWIPKISVDGLSLFFGSNRPGGLGDFDIWVTTRRTTNEDWEKPVNLGPPVNSSSFERAPSISADSLSLFLISNRPGGLGGIDLWVSRRPRTNEPWEIPVNLGPAVNSSTNDVSPYILSDGSALLFSSNRTGGFGSYDIWQVSINPVVDFNGDGIVDVKDIVIITEHWGENYPLCDIGPMPWGDGIVDVQDLVVLTEYIEPLDRTLIAHWTLDETEGMFAVDSAGDNDAVVIGGATWQPGSGQVDGALQLNGVDGYAITGAVLNPADGPFSVLAWINGGAPGQVVVSQQNSANWLTTDAEGNLMTELKGAGRSTGPLFSETVITDGQWHRIGLVWDGSHRTLYVDGVVVADDIQPGLQGSQMGLYIGTGKAMESGTYFSGLIDDVRIYNRAVSP